MVIALETYDSIWKAIFSKNQTNTEGAVVMPSVVLSSSKVEKDSPQEVNNWAAAMAPWAKITAEML